MGMGMSGEGDLGRHKRNLSNWSHLTERSAARPDSEVMPFENFIYSLNTACDGRGGDVAG